jgi:general secretion pathway protein L
MEQDAMADRPLTLPSLSPHVQEFARRFGLAGFWTWWSGQLGPLVPAAPRAAVAHRRMRPVLLFDGDHATLWRPVLDQGRATMQQGPSIPLSGDASANAAGHAALKLLAPMVYGGTASALRIVVAVPARDVLRKQIVLPAAVEENLLQALTYDLDRHTPFKADELYFDAVVTRRDPARGTIDVDLAAVRRTVVDPALKHAAAWGAEVVAVVPAAADIAAPSRVNLLPPAMRPARSFWRRWQFWIPLAVLSLLALAAVAIPLWQKRDYAIQLNTIADQARAQAAISETLRQELDGKVADYNTALERKFAFPGALQTLNFVSKLLPDDTWLTQLELKSVTKGKEVQKEVFVRGETGNAGRLVQLFEDSQHFAQAAPRAPTTKIQPGPGEIFDLGAQLKPRAAPERMPLVVRAPPGGTTPEGTATAVGTPAAAALNTGTTPVTAGKAPATTAPATTTPATTTPATTTPATTTPATTTPATTTPATTTPATTPVVPAAAGAVPKASPIPPASGPAAGNPGGLPPASAAAVPKAPDPAVKAKP